MRKKLDTRFPAARIKKIMQADEDVGKIAMAVPLLVSKALELFLQDLCNRTYEVTVKRGAKTLNSMHLKQCVQSFNMFDFLQDTVSKVSDLGGVDAANEDKSTTKRKISYDDKCGNEHGSKRIRMHETSQTSSDGRSRGRGRGRGRGSKKLHRKSLDQFERLDYDSDISNQSGKNQNEKLERSCSVVADTTADSRITGGKDADKAVFTFDLNVELDENGDSILLNDGTPSDSSEKPSPGTRHEDIPGWSLDNMEMLAFDVIQLASLKKRMDEEDEDYDEEG
ncbi:dr1-associated corepressor-like [Salvia splendens]|uniref:dr1-associated corepressor-like n=1 Tax=Salvia splendens TaxID=180675 RepID=UPI001C274C1D|nr:dr1-associated corepressor-like [Salvia splendens]XP_042021542.1 dr1-associated corepressor-like [Salvia splendens]